MTRNTPGATAPSYMYTELPPLSFPAEDYDVPDEAAAAIKAAGFTALTVLTVNGFEQQEL